jgi:hypothetical protein
MRLAAGAIALMLLLPSVAAANTMIQSPPQEQGTEAHKGKMESQGKHRMTFEVKEVELQSWAEKYTPEKAEEWKTVLAERKQLHEKWMSPEMAPKREAFEKERQAKIEEIKALRQQFEAGKLTREEFLKRAHEKMQHNGATSMKGHAVYPRLHAAVEKGDTKEAGLLLNELLVFFKSHNERLADRMK